MRKLAPVARPDPAKMALVIGQSRDVCPLLAEDVDFAFFKA
ncbi:hypothetical protein [Mesorhizobium sp. M0482]